MARKKRQKNRSKQQKAAKPKFGRSPWASKPRNVSKQAYLRGMRKKFAFLPFSKAFFEAKRFGRIGLENIPEAEKRAFVWANRQAAAKERADISIRAKKGRKFTVKTAGKILSQQLGDMKGQELDDWVRVAKKAVIDNESGKAGRRFVSMEETKRVGREKLWQKIQGHIKEYFRARKIPVRTESEKAALNATVNTLLFEKRMTKVTRPLDLAWIEQTYLGHRKLFKGVDQEDAVYRNTLLREIFGGERLTANQRRAAKKWILRNLPKLEEEKRAITKRLFPKMWNKAKPENVEQAVREFSEAEERFKERTRTELLKLFRGKKKKVAQKARPANQRVKPGARAERMAAYRPREKTMTERKREMRKEEQKAKLAGKAFDSVAFAIKEIGFESRPTAAFLKGLLDKRLLKKDSLTRLFTSGSLTQKVFQTVVNDPEFRNRFGSSNIDRLAGGLAYIGPGGRQTEGVKRAFQGEKGKKLFEFLARKGFIDTRHGRGMTVTYLARLKGQ